MKNINKVQTRSAFLREHCRGDVRADGKTFNCYRFEGEKVYEQWCSPEQLAKEKAGSSRAAAAWAKRPENRQRVVEYAKKSNAIRRKIHPQKFMLAAAKKRAKDAGLPFNICEDDIVVPSTCPVLGIAIETAVGRMQDNSPSLDRIIPELGYVKGNVSVISWRANKIKGDATPDELEMVLKYVRQ
ncbi:MAG: hypothetical protein GX466_08900 [Candidatus Cloacimonetes bacterium]|nr:hypothetical protein [Candidatus Cloacimonadota bacterium]